MTGTLHKFPSLKELEMSTLLDAAETVVEEVKTGKYESVLSVCFYETGGCTIITSMGIDPLQKIAALEALKFELLNAGRSEG